jgi:acylphosphatase
MTGNVQGIISHVKNISEKQGVHRMVTKTSNGKIKKTSRGMRKHVRRMKQESRKTGVPVNELKKKVRTPQVSKIKKEA